RRWESYSWAVVSILLQSGVLVYSGVATYHLAYKKEDEPVVNYAYPLTAIGTVLMGIGLIICFLVVETSTVEETWLCKENDARIVLLQQCGDISYQGIASYAIFARAPRSEIRTSRHMSHSSHKPMDWIRPDSNAPRKHLEKEAHRSSTT